MQNNEIKIEFYGHSFFRVSSNELIAVFDPVGEETGYKFDKKINANLLLISHEHYDHSNRELIKLDEKDNINEFAKVDVIDSFHDEKQGEKRGLNKIHVLMINSFKICHLGDLGHILDEKQINAIGKVDVLMIPVGGTFTIDSFKSFEVARQIDAKVIIPMHYMTDKLNFELEPVENFLINAKDEFKVQKIDTNEIILSKEKLEEKVVYVLDIKR